MSDTNANTVSIGCWKTNRRSCAKLFDWQHSRSRSGKASASLRKFIAAATVIFWYVTQPHGTRCVSEAPTICNVVHVSLYIALSCHRRSYRLGLVCYFPFGFESRRSRITQSCNISLVLPSVPIPLLSAFIKTELESVCNINQHYTHIRMSIAAHRIVCAIHWTCRGGDPSQSQAIFRGKSKEYIFIDGVSRRAWHLQSVLSKIGYWINVDCVRRAWWTVCCFLCSVICVPSKWHTESYSAHHSTVSLEWRMRLVDHLPTALNIER